jgi:hypothetical protein
LGKTSTFWKKRNNEEECILPYTGTHISQQKLVPWISETEKKEIREKYNRL